MAVSDQLKYEGSQHQMQQIMLSLLGLLPSAGMQKRNFCTMASTETPGVGHTPANTEAGGDFCLYSTTGATTFESIYYNTDGSSQGWVIVL